MFELFLRAIAALGYCRMHTLSGCSGSSMSFEENVGVNPFFNVHVSGRIALQMADLDDDGYEDAIFNDDSILLILRNNGNNTFSYRTNDKTGSQKIFEVNFLENIEFIETHDYDHDGDVDIFLIHEKAKFVRLVNIGNASFPRFQIDDLIESPFPGIPLASQSTIEFIDLDDDGDSDAVLGGSSGGLQYFENIGLNNVPVYSEAIGLLNPFFGVDVGQHSSPSCMDYDNDGDIDCFIGNFEGKILLYENTGSYVLPVFTERAQSNNPLNGVDVGYFSTLIFWDYDNDGDDDMLVSSTSSNIRFFENRRPSTTSTFFNRNGDSNPFNVMKNSPYRTLAFADLNNDTTVEFVSGSIYGTVEYFQNSRKSVLTNHRFSIGENNPFSSIWAGKYSVPALADFDGDGDYDAIFGGEKLLLYAENEGNASYPSFSTTSFVYPLVDERCSPAVADIDNDGDHDVVIGNKMGTLSYLENIGSKTKYHFVQRSGHQNPFLGIDVGSYSFPTFGDLDGDRDLDLLIGSSSGALLYVKNVGTIAAPAFVEQRSDENPFFGIELSSFAAPELFDIDDDGDPDLIVSTSDGAIHLYSNNVCVKTEACSNSGYCKYQHSFLNY